MNDTTPETTKLSWWRRLSSGLKRTSSSLGTAVADLVTKRKLDRAMLDDIEDVLLRADLGTEVAARIAAAVGDGRYDKAISADDVKIGGRDRSREGACAGGEAARDRRGAKAVRHSRGRRQRLRQDHHHRQARGETRRRRPQGDAGGRRHLSRRRDRAAQDLGRAHQIAGHRGRAGLGFREPCLQRADRGARAASSTCC